MTTPEQDTSDSLEYADEEEGSQEGDRRRYTNTLERPSSIGGKAHDDGDVTTTQEIPNRWDAEHPRPTATSQLRMAATRIRAGLVMLVPPAPGR